MKTITGTIRFPGRFIAEPYWPDLAKAIDIDKQSGVSRARSEAARTKALDAHLKKLGMTLDDFYALQRSAKRPFWTVRDLRNNHMPIAGTHADDEIIIPPDNILAAFVQGCDQAPAAVRIAKPDNLRSVVEAETIYTGKTTPDGTWTRPVVPKKDGKPLSNQRGTRSSDYIADFSAALVLHYSEASVTAERLRDFCAWVGREVGIGASRKMNNGRFNVTWK
jgi:hypothetical protein